MDTKLIAWAGKVSLKNKSGPFSLEDWSKLWSKTLDQSKLISKDPDTLAFLRGILKIKAADNVWLEGHIPWTPTWPEPKVSEGVRELGEEKLDDDILSELDQKLLEVGDGKVHRRFLRSARATYLGTPRPLLPATLRRLANHYPLTQRALDYLRAWENNPQSLEEEPKQNSQLKAKKRERWPWKPILLGFFLAALVLALIYLILKNNFTPNPADPQPSPESGLPLLQENPVDLPPSPASEPVNQESAGAEEATTDEGVATQEPLPIAETSSPVVQESAPVPAPVQNLRSYTVQAGDSLSLIAEKQMYNLQAWPEIYDLNKTLVTDPNFILPGWRLQLPER